MSVLVGFVFGVGISFFFKKFESYNQFAIRETSIILIGGYLSYLVAEVFELSGIDIIFINIFIRDYNFICMWINNGTLYISEYFRRKSKRNSFGF